MQIGPVTLDGQHVRLEPVCLAHVPALWRVGAPEEIWRYLPYAIRSESRQALARLGATEEGTFRNHMVMPGGRIRHSVYFSLTNDEWPGIKAHLEGLMASYPAASAALLSKNTTILEKTS